jgi:phage tail-like protein
MPRTDPYPAYNFLVEIDGISESGFSEVSGLEAEIEVIEYRNGSDSANTVRKLQGLQKFSNITLKRGFTADLSIWKWIDNALQGSVMRANISIILLDEARNPLMRWNFINAWPCKWKVSMLNAKESGVVIEMLEICHEGMSIAT